MGILFRGLALAVSAVALTACGGGSDEPSGSEASGETPAAATANAEAPAIDNVETLDGTTLAQFTPDAEQGARIFMQCKSCHVLVPGQNRTGPSLAGIIGAEAGAVDTYKYTPANAESGIVWTKEKMFQYLENPRRVIPGTKMAFAGLRDGQDRADLIAYLENPTD